MAASEILLTLVVSLMISSCLISAVILDKEHSDLSRVNPDIDIPLLIGIQDYTNSSSYNSSVFYVPILSSGWAFNEGIGAISLGGSWLNPNSVNLLNVQSDNGVYDVTYLINNSVKQDFRIKVRVSQGLFGYNIYLDFTSNGIRYPNGILPILTNYEYAYPNITQIEDITIRTILNENLNKLTVYVNGQNLFTCDVNSNEGNLVGATYAGISATGYGLTIKAVDVPIILNETNILAQFLNFLTIFFKLIAWNVSEKYLPFLLNIILIKTQMVGIFIALVVIARGGA